MNKQLNKIPKDTILLFSSGEYSDYRLLGLCKALEDIDTDSLRDEYLTLHPEESLNYKFSESGFIKFLEEKKLVNSVGGMEWYLGAYNKISEMEVSAAPILFN